MQTVRRVAAVLICPAVAWLGAACERAVERTAELLASTGTTRAALRDRKGP